MPFTDSKVIFSYDGRIKAGIDFGEVDVSVNELTKTITVKLPEVKILNSEVFNDSLIVYDEKNSPFNSFTFEDMNLSISELKKSAEETAIEKGFLETALENAENIIKTSISGFYDLKKYEVRFE